MVDKGSNQIVASQTVTHSGFQSKMPLPEHYHSLDAVLNAAWTHLLGGAADRRSGFHIATVATVSNAGAPNLRTVVLRRFKPDLRELVFHTDIRSRKAEEIAAKPMLGILFYSPSDKIQMRLQCKARIDTQNDVSEDSWRRSLPMSRACYAQSLAPGADASDAIADQEPLDSEKAFRNFAVVTCTIESLDWLYLAVQGHRRAFFQWKDGIETRSWLAP